MYFTVAYYNKVRNDTILGNIEAKADAKGRVFIPATFRKQLQAASEEKTRVAWDVYQDYLVLYRKVYGLPPKPTSLPTE